jgi:uncharacterized phage protein (TIGR01671 family)
MSERQLKFRVWDDTQKKFEYFELQDITVPTRLLMQHNFPVQQFTGIKDKNGKEIYEGDILVAKHNGGEGEANVGQVFFAAGAFMVDGDGTLYDHTLSLSPDIVFDSTVEGNVFENPELLKNE